MSCGSLVIPCRQTDRTTLIVAFPNFANRLKNVPRITCDFYLGTAYFKS